MKPKGVHKDGSKLVPIMGVHSRPDRTHCEEPGREHCLYAP